MGVAKRVSVIAALAGVAAVRLQTESAGRVSLRALRRGTQQKLVRSSTRGFADGDDDDDSEDVGAAPEGGAPEGEGGAPEGGAPEGPSAETDGMPPAEAGEADVFDSPAAEAAAQEAVKGEPAVEVKPGNMQPVAPPAPPAPTKTEHDQPDCECEKQDEFCHHGACIKKGFGGYECGNHGFVLVILGGTLGKESEHTKALFVQLVFIALVTRQQGRVCAHVVSDGFQ